MKEIKIILLTCFELDSLNFDFLILYFLKDWNATVPTAIPAIAKLI